MSLYLNGGRGGDRTHNPRLRRPVLYPIELLAPQMGIPCASHLLYPTATRACEDPAGVQLKYQTIPRLLHRASARFLLQRIAFKPAGMHQECQQSTLRPIAVVPTGIRKKGAVASL